MATQNAARNTQHSGKKPVNTGLQFISRYVAKVSQGSLPSGIQQIDTKAPIRDQFNIVVSNELAALLWYMTFTHEQNAAFKWSVQQRRDAYRYVRVLTHGDEANQDYSTLTEEQIQAIRVIFMVLCIIESRYMLTRSWQDSTNAWQRQEITLPGMMADWYTDQIDQINDWVEAELASIRKESEPKQFIRNWRRGASDLLLNWRVAELTKPDDVAVTNEAPVAELVSIEA